MIGKNNQYLKKTKEGTKVETYSIKKFKVGAASVVIGASIFFGAGAVAQASEDVSKNTIIDNSKNEGVTVDSPVSEKIEVKSVVKEATKEEVAAGVATKLGVKETEQESAKETVKTLDKTQLSNFIGEIEGKISSGAYVNKTEESIANLIVDLNSAKATLESATTQDELTKAYQKLVVSVNSKLRNKPVEKKETPVVESTTPKETVGNKAENTEKKVETNSIENMSTKDSRNGKEIAKNTAFRAAVNQDPKVDFTFSIPSEKKIYIYNEEHFSLEIPVYSESGKIRFATIKQGSRQRFANVAGTENDLDIQYGFTATVINRAETVGVTTNASQANPAKIVITGRPNDALKKHRDYTKQETQTLNVGTRYVQVVDDQGRENLKKGIDITDPGYFYLVLKAQSKKYALRSQPTDEKISVSSLTNPTAEDLQKIKDSIQLEYSTTNEDARFADKRGTLVEHPEDVIQSVGIVGNNIVVTFTDGSTKTKPVSEIIQKNILPVVNLPYSNETNRNIYIYSGEETDLTFTATDESKIKDMKLRGPGDVNYNNATNYGLTLGNVVDGAVASGEGSVSEDKKTATIKMTGTTNLRDGQKWTSVIVAKDDNNGESAPFNGRINATTNPAERQKIAGYAEFVVKNQTKKYDIKAPEGTVSVIDPANVTAEEFEKIKEKVKIEYSQTNDDANFIGKRGQVVDNQATRISTITKDASGNLVVTYKDGSTDTKPLSEYVSLNKQPAIDAINTAADNKIAEINSNTNATAEEKATAIQKVNADKAKALTAINDNSVTTKSALDNAKTSGTTAISNDNPVATKKDTAKSAIDTALREKEAAIDANNALTTEEKNAAKADAQAKATAAKTAIDNATTNAAVDSAKTAGTTSVSSVTPTAAAKPAAKNAIDEALKAKEAQLDARADLTDEEKKAAKADAQAKATAAKAAIDNATTNATVDNAKTSGVADVESVNPQASQKKTDAKNAVDEALKAKNDAIDARTDLTAEEKTAAKADAKAKADAAKTAIDNATTNDAVTQAKNDGATSVDSVNPTAQAKPAAKKAIDDALKAKNDAIDANNDLTDEEKTAAKADAKAKAAAAKQAIDNATTNAGVDQAKANGTTEVKAVDPQPVAKTEAKKAIDDALKAKNDEIAARTDLTDEEKAKAKEDVKAKADAAKQAIDKATTNSEVDQAKTAGTAEVKAVDPQPVAKAEAKKAIDETLKAKNDEIDARTDLTDEEKTAAKANAKAIADAAKETIDKAVTNAEVEQAKTYGTSEVTSVNPEAVVKTEAKKAVDEALKAKNDEIDARTDLTDEEKIAAKAEAKEKADEVKQAIDKATTNAEVDQAKTNGTTEVKAVDPQPVAKTEAKKAIDEALKTKNDETDARTDLTDEEKTAAKAYAQAKANVAKEEIDKATTNAEVEQAKTNGTLDVTSVDPQPVAKPEAKKAIDEVLKAKNDEIDARRDLTDEEKVKAKEEAKEKADAAKKAIDRATTDEEVEQTEINGTTEVKAVDPQPVAKPEAKKAIDEVLKAKNDEIDARTDLTDEEKIAAKAEAKAKADAAKEGIDIATTNAEIDQIKKNGTTEVTSVNPEAVAKTEAKEAIDEILKSKNDEIDARTDLTDEEKTAAKEEAKTKADAAKEAIDKATTNAEVAQAKANGAKEVASVDPEALVKSVAKKAIEDKLAEQLKVIANTPDATDEEKKAASDLAKQLAEVAKKAIDAARENADVKKIQDNSKVGIEEAVPFVEDKPNARKAIDAEVKVKKAAIDARTDISDKVKELLKAEVDEIAVQAKKAIDAASSVDEIKKIEEAKKSEIKAVEEVRVPAEKVIVADPTNLTNEEKAKVLAAIKSVNPDVKEITQDAKGNVIVITANGHKQVISVAQVTKTEADLAKEKAGNVVNAPVAKTVVADVTKLTEAEKQEIIAKVKAVNPGATVAIDEKGNIIVTNGEGLVFVLPVLDLVIPTDKLTDITANSKVNTPAIRTLVANKGSLTPEEIAKIKAAIEEINPGAIVVVDAKGNATVTTKDGKSMTISSDVLVKDAADVAVKNNGENINLDFDKEVVADINNLTESDKEKVKFKVLGAIREAVELVVDAKGNVTVIFKDGRTFTILAKDIFEQRKEVTVNLPEKIKVKDASNLTETEKEAVKQALITANPNLKDAKVTISNTGEATIVYPDGQVVVISAKNLVVAEKVTGVIIEDNKGNYTKEDKQPAVDYSNDNTPKFNAKKGQRLANTGEAETNTGLAGLGMALLGGLVAVVKRRKEKEE